MTAHKYARKLSDQQVQHLLSDYKKGMKVDVLSEKYTVDAAAVCYHCRKHGVQRRGRSGAPPKYDGLETHLTCSACKKVLPVAAFGPASSKTKRSRNTRCRSCVALLRKLRAYQVTAAQYAKLVDKNACDLCGKPFSKRGPFIDHDHSTGRIRGVLCEPCNTGLGLFNDSQTLLAYAQEYLSTDLCIPAAEAPLVKTAYRRYKAYGLQDNQWHWLSAVAGGACMLCGRKWHTLGKTRPCIDHDHRSGRVRGLLCFYCNLALGKFQDNVNTLRRASEYLGKQVHA